MQTHKHNIDMDKIIVMKHSSVCLEGRGECVLERFDVYFQTEAKL